MSDSHDPGNHSTAEHSASSRSLTTLIRDLHAEFPELGDTIDDDSWAQSLTSDEDPILARSQTSLAPTTDPEASPTLSSLLCELELLAANVKALPVPRPPSLSSEDWKSALDSPDSEIYTPSLLEEDCPYDVVVEPEEDSYPSNTRPLVSRRSATMNIRNCMPSTPRLDTHPSEEDCGPQAVSLPPRSRSLKSVLSSKRAVPAVPAGTALPSAPVCKSRSRGITYPHLNTKWRAEQNIMHSLPVEPVSFLLF